MGGVLHENYCFLARYNRWINQRLFDACERLSDEERKQERGAFFGSLHRTLNHLVVADQVWLKRLVSSQKNASWMMLPESTIPVMAPMKAGKKEKKRGTGSVGDM